MVITRDGFAIQTALQRAEQLFPEREIVSRTPAGMFRYTYREFAQRVGKLASALVASGVRKGDRVATLAWNQHRHLEACFAVPAIGAVLHTLNLRLSPDQLTHTIKRAADKMILIDADLLPRLESCGPAFTTVERCIIMSDGSGVQTRLSPMTSYEALIKVAEQMRKLPEANEWDEAGICFDSTAGRVPREVPCTHGALWRHGRAFCLADTVGVSAQDTILMVVPLFHVNAQGLPLAALWTGSKLVLPGPHPDAQVFCELMDQERVTLAAGVPAVWIEVLALLQGQPHRASGADRIFCRALPLEQIRRTAERRAGSGVDVTDRLRC